MTYKRSRFLYETKYCNNCVKFCSKRHNAMQL